MDDEEKETVEDETKLTSENKIRQRQPRNQISSDAESTECPECGKVFSLKKNLREHIQSVHEGVKYACRHCDYQATQQGNLRTHIKKNHEDLTCDLCGKQYSDYNSLTIHIQYQHCDEPC